MRKRIKNIILFCSMIGVIFCFTACGQKDEKPNIQGEGQATMLELHIATMPSIDKVPLIIGMEKGFFANHGLTVVNENFQSPTDRDAALQSGKMDGVMSDMVAFALYLESGMKLKMTSLVQTGFGVLASPQSGLTSLAAIQEANTCGISLNGLIEYLADQAGAGEKVLLPAVSNRVEQLLAGKIDLTVVPEPYVTMGVNQGAVLLATDKDLQVQAAVMLFTEEALANKKEAIAAFYAGYRDSLAYMRETDPKEYIDLVIEKGDFAPEIAEVLQNTVFEDLQFPQEEQFVAILDWMQAKEELTGNYDFTFAEVVDDRFFK